MLYAKNFFYSFLTVNIEFSLHYLSRIIILQLL